MLKIGEFSQLGQVSVRMLRHYDQLGLLKPAVVDRFTDYRYYTLEQLPRLNRILALRELGFSLEQTVRLLDSELSAEQLRGMLLLRQTEIEQQLREEQARLAMVAARIRQIEQQGRFPSYEILLKQVEPLMVVSQRMIVPGVAEMDHYCSAQFAAIYRWLQEQRATAMPPELTIYHNSEYSEENIDMEAAVAPAPADLARLKQATVGGWLVVRELPAVGTMASVVYRGTMPLVGEPIMALFAWLAQSDYAVAGPLREVHLFGRTIDLPDHRAEKVVLELQLPVERRR